MTSLKNRGSKSQYVLKGFVMFEYDDFAKIINGKIFCARKLYKGTGNILLECVKDFDIRNKVVLWRINSLPFEPLLHYYENFGFERRDNIYIKGKLKVVLMVKILEYKDEDEEDENSEEES
uniref:N-acetyltransferase domain-containing protein n=1 Tax=viral metagenome TaxID=1070528 RepID=A0A6C0AF32_9ZZZZ